MANRYAKYNGSQYDPNDYENFWKPEKFYGQPKRPANNNDPFRRAPLTSRPFGKKGTPTPTQGSPTGGNWRERLSELIRQGWQIGQFMPDPLFVGVAGAGVYWLWKYVDGYQGHERRPDPRTFRRVEVCPDPLHPNHTHMGWNNVDAGHLICIDGQSTANVWPELTTLPDWVTSLTLWDIYDQGGIDRGHMMEHWVRTQQNNQVVPAGGYAWTWVQGVPDHMPNPNGNRNAPGPAPLPGDMPAPLPDPVPNPFPDPPPSEWPYPLPPHKPRWQYNWDNVPIARSGSPNKSRPGNRPGQKPLPFNGTKNRPRPSQKRGKRTKERKRKVGHTIFRLVDYFSERSETVGALYDSLPLPVRRKWEKKLGFHYVYFKSDGKWHWLPPRELERGLTDNAGQYGIDGADWKLKALWYNWHSIDEVEAIKLMIRNEIQDMVLGWIMAKQPVNVGHTNDAAMKKINKLLDKEMERVDGYIEDLFYPLQRPLNVRNPLREEHTP